MTDLGELSWCLGIQVAQCQQCMTNSKEWHSQDAGEIRNARLQTSKTPAAVHFKKDCLSAEESLSEEGTQRYQSIIVSLMYAVIGTIPDMLLFWASCRSMYRDLVRIILLLLKTFNIPSIFKRLSSEVLSKKSYGKVIPLWLSWCIMGMSERGFFNYRFCLQSFDWTNQLVWKETINNCSILCCSGSDLVETLT